MNSSNSSSRPSIRCPARFNDDEVYVSGSVDDQGTPAFWIEKPDGGRWLDISQPASTVRGVDTRREIVALSCNDDMLVRTALGTGWFTRTGRNVQYPVNESNEVWALSPACREMFAQVGLLLDETCSTPGAFAHNTVGAAPEVSLFEVLSGWIEKLRDVQVSSVVVTVPNPFSRTAGARFLVASFPDSLRKSASLFETDEWAPQERPLTEWHYLDALQTPRWSSLMLERGYKSVIILRAPVASGQYIECLMFGDGSQLDSNQAAVSICTALSVLPQLKQATSSAVCNLTPRERMCLLSAFQGKTANETAKALDCATRTVRLHLSNAMCKLGTGNTISAIQRAQMLGIL